MSVSCDWTRIQKNIGRLWSARLIWKMRWRSSTTWHKRKLGWSLRKIWGRRMLLNVRHLITSSILAMGPYASFQKTNCEITSTNGSPHKIHQLTIMLHVAPITRKPQPGSSKETFTRNGNQKDPSSGSTESVRPVPTFYSILPDNSLTF